MYHQVTLSEGPNHIAQFKGSSKVFDLTQESEVSGLPGQYGSFQVSVGVSIFFSSTKNNSLVIYSNI